MNASAPNTWIHTIEDKLVVIHTWHCYPPIPDRGSDWAAYYEDEQEYGNYGWGRTEEDAVQNLVDNYYPGEDLHDSEPDYNIETAQESYERTWKDKRESH